MDKRKKNINSISLFQDSTHECRQLNKTKLYNILDVYPCDRRGSFVDLISLIIIV